MKHFRISLASIVAAAVAALVAACGGGGSDSSTSTQITSVKVFGDSLADSGTFGMKFTVQGSGGKSYSIYPDYIAAAYGASALCPFFLYTGSTFVANPTAGCGNYAIGGGRINHTTAPTTPLSITTQLSLAASAGSYKATDMVVIDGGGNDAADLVGAYLAAGGGDPTSLLALGTSLLGASAATTLAQTNGAALLGGQYMAALANTFYSSIKTTVLDKGAQHVVLLNIPGITNTPRFQMVLDGIAAQVAATSGSAAGATARAQSETLFKSWIETFNTTLASKVSGDGRVVLVDVYAALNREVATPSQYGLQNAKDAVCPVTGLGTDGLPTYDFATCTDTALSATTPPSGATGGSSWWKTYLFSDGFHPTPYGHQLTYQQIALDLAKSGRL